jgi:hypothetical protein
MIDCLLEMAATEWEHEKFFRETIAGHRMLRFFKLWDPPPPKELIGGRIPDEVPPCSVPASRS